MIGLLLIGGLVVLAETQKSYKLDISQVPKFALGAYKPVSGGKSGTTFSGGGLVGGPDAVFDLQGLVDCKEVLAGGPMTDKCTEALEKRVVAVGTKVYNAGVDAYNEVKSWF